MLPWKHLSIRTFLLSIMIRCVYQKKGNTGSTKFSFGGCIEQIEKHSNGTHMNEAVEYAVKHASKRFPTKFPIDQLGNILTYKIVDSSLSKIMFTHDGKIPFMVQTFDEKTRQPTHTHLIWGLIYSFSVLWDHPDDSLGLQHFFVVFQYWDNEFYTYQHTFRPRIYHPPKDTLYEEIPHLDIQRLSGYTHTDDKVPILNIAPVPEAGGNGLHTRHKNVLASEKQESCFVKGSLEAGDLDSDYPADCVQSRVKDMRSGAKSQFLNLALRKCPIEDTPISKSSENEPLKTHLDGEHTTTTDFAYRHQRHTRPENISSTLKVLSFNVWNVNTVSEGRNNYEKRMRRLAKICRESRSDVIGFQEVRFQDGKGERLGPNQIGHLIEYLPEYQYIYQPAQIQIDGLPKFVAEGLAFLSKYPIISHDYLFLKRNPRDGADGHQRILLHIEVELPTYGKGTGLTSLGERTRPRSFLVAHFFNTHLSLSHKARATSVVQIWKYMNKFSGPAFLMGDFNSEAHNTEVKFLGGQKELKKVRTSGLHDVWRLKHGNSSKGFTFNTLDPTLTKRIDLIFMRDHHKVHLDDVLLLDDGKRGESAASDHLGLLAVFKSN